MKLELDNGSLTYQPTCVMYKGKRYDAPVFLTTLLAMDYITKLLKTKQNMKKYTLEVIMNVSQKLKEYEVIADYFEWSNSGCYVFYTSNEHRNKIISSYPISRTIIKQIEDVND